MPQLKLILTELKPEKAISGMALGVDTYAAMICIELGINLIAAIPFIGQEKVWPEQSKKMYRELLDKASEKVIVSDGEYAAYKLQKRNEWMVDHSDLLIAVWNGDQSGGTFNCIQYAKKKEKPIRYINPMI